MNKFVFSLLVLIITNSANLFATNELKIKPKIKVKFNISYTNLNEDLKIYRSHKNSSLNKYQLANSLKQINLISLIEDNQVLINDGDRVDLALVLHNKSSSPIFYYAGNHIFEPTINSIGFSFLPPDTGRIAQLPAGKYAIFYSYISIKNLKFDKALSISIPIVGISESKARQLMHSNPEIEGGL